MWVMSGLGMIRTLDIGHWTLDIGDGQVFDRCGDLSAFHVYLHGLYLGDGSCHSSLTGS